MILKTKSNDIIFIVSIFLIPIILCIFRPLDSADTNGYLSYYNNAIDGTINNKVEWSFILIARLCNALYPGVPGFRLVLFVYSLIASGILLIILAQEKSPVLSFFIYFSFAFSYQMCIQIRSCVANLLFLLAIADIVERRPLKYYSKIFVAFFFHQSSVFFLLIYPFCRYVFDKKKVCYILPVFFITISVLFSGVMLVIIHSLKGFSNLSFVQVLIDYTQNTYSIHKVNPLNRISIFEILIYYFSLLFLYDKFSAREQIILSIIPISIFCYFFGAFNLPIIAERYPEAINLVLVLFLPIMVSYIKEKWLMYTLILLFLFLINIQYNTLEQTVGYFVGLSLI